MEKKTGLTERQLDIMRVLWQQKEATILEVQGKLSQKVTISRNAAATILTRLEKQGFVSHRVEDKTYIYFPLVAEKDIQKSMVSEMKKILFQGESVELVSCLLNSDELSTEEIEAVRKLIDSHEKRQN